MIFKIYLIHGLYVRIYFILATREKKLMLKILKYYERELRTRVIFMRHVPYRLIYHASFMLAEICISACHI